MKRLIKTNKILLVIFMCMNIVSCNLKPVFDDTNFGKENIHKLSSIKTNFANNYETHIFKKSLDKFMNLDNNNLEKQYILEANITKKLEGVAVNDIGIETRKRLHLTIQYTLKSLTGEILLEKKHYFFTDFAIDSYYYSSTVIEENMLKNGIDYLTRYVRNDLITYFTKQNNIK